MAFSDYKDIAQVQREYHIKYREENFIPLGRLEPSAHFLEEFTFNQTYLDVFSSEGARAEAVIFPVLREVFKRHHDLLTLWIQKPITCDAKLSGTPDYIVAVASELGKTVLEPPLVMMTEAKKNDFEQGWGQCLAELIAAQRLNGTPNLPVFGVVTDGLTWQFGKLTNSTFLKHSAPSTISDLAELLSMLDFIFQSARASAHPQNGAALHIRPE